MGHPVVVCQADHVGVFHRFGEWLSVMDRLSPSGYSYIQDPYADLYLLFIRESSEYVQYSYLFMARTLSWHLLFIQDSFSDLLRFVFSSYVFYRLNLVLLFVSFVAHVIV